nr:hypothetical protein [uncultured Duganella sp.]
MCWPARRTTRWRRAVDWDDIGAHPYMAVAQTSGNRLLLDRARRPADQRVPGFIEVSHVSTLLRGGWSNCSSNRWPGIPPAPPKPRKRSLGATHCDFFALRRKVVGPGGEVQ